MARDFANQALWIIGRDGYFDGQVIRDRAHLGRALDAAHATIERFEKSGFAAVALIIRWENGVAVKVGPVAYTKRRPRALMTSVSKTLASIGLNAKSLRLAASEPKSASAPKKAPPKKTSTKKKLPASSAEFKLGAVVATPGVLATFTRAHIAGALDLYESRSWGKPPVTSKTENERHANANTGRISGSYVFQGLPGRPTLWIITEGGREDPPRRTTLLLPGDY